MKLSTRARYALRMMLAISKHEDGGLVTLGDVSRRTGISRRYLEQLATAMKHASLLRGRAGRGGGYSLTRPPGEVRISEIVEAAIGPINVVECVLEPEVCVKSTDCECRWVYERINDGIAGLLGGMSLADLVRKGQSGNGRGEDHQGDEGPGHP